MGIKKVTTYIILQAQPPHMALINNQVTHNSQKAVFSV